MEELKKSIEASKKLLKSYRGYGQMVVDAINALNEIEKYIDDPSEEELPRIKEIANEMNSKIGPYKGFVPQVASTIDKILEYLNAG